MPGTLVKPMQDIRDWAFGVLLVCAAIVGLIEWNRPDVDYFWRAWAETGLRAASRVDDGKQALQLAEWAFALREDSVDSRTVERLSALLQRNGRSRDRAALLAFEALRSRSARQKALARQAYDAEPSVLTGWLLARSYLAAGEPVPAEVEAQIAAQDWQYADYYACHKKGKPALRGLKPFPNFNRRFGDRSRWNSAWPATLNTGALGLQRNALGELPKLAASPPNPLAAAQCVVERQESMNDAGLRQSAEALLSADKEAAYWANAANAQSQVNRRVADRNAWTPLAKQNKFGACVAGAFLPDAKDVAMYGAAAVSKTMRRKVIPVLGTLIGAADCGQAMNKIDEARKQVNLLSSEIRHITSGETLKAHRATRSAAAKEFQQELQRRLTSSYYRFGAEQALEVFDGRAIDSVFLR